jgi:DNA invertase Pin-like site-specific DNA recombinase
VDAYIGYIRVSAVKGRAEGGEGAIEQREQIERWEQSRDVEIVEWQEDFDQSGGKITRPGLTRAIKRIEDGEADGIVVAKLNRLSRLKRYDAFKLVDRIDIAGGKLAALDFGIDPTTPTGELMLTLLLGIARMEHRTLSEGLASSKERRRQEGVHLAPAPLGYIRPAKNSPLAKGDAAPLVRECFLRRARGASWMDLVRYLAEHGHQVSKSSVGYMLQSRTYLGEIQGGDGQVGHEPIVTEDEWDAAQGVGRPHGRDGTTASEGIVAGLLTCAGCGHKLSIGRNGATQADGRRAARYCCRRHFASGSCPAPASGNVAAVDDFIVQAIDQAVGDGTVDSTIDAVARYSRAKAAVDQAQAELDGLKANSTSLVRSLGAEGYAAAATAQKDLLDAAKRGLREAPRPDDAIVPDSFWGTEMWTVERKRRLARQLIAEVTLTKSRLPVSERVAITWAGHDGPDVTVGERIAATAESAAKLAA